MDREKLWYRHPEFNTKEPEKGAWNDLLDYIYCKYFPACFCNEPDHDKTNLRLSTVS